MSTDRMVYVAADPEQPGAAWAIAADAGPEDKVWRKELAKTLADWMRRGATVMHVTHRVGCDMLDKYEKKRAADESTQGSLL